MTESTTVTGDGSSEVSSRRGKLSRERQQLLERRLRGEPGRQAAAPMQIPKRTDTGPQPLSLSQQRLWFIDQMEAARPAYHVSCAVRLLGLLDVPALQAALDTIVQRHESLRTTFVNAKGNPQQVIAPYAKFTLDVVDLHGTAEAIEEQVHRYAQREVVAQFSLSTGPLIRGVLLCLDDATHVLLVTMHHIISDGWSVGVLIREVSELYAAYRVGRPNPLSELPLQYADYANWQRTWLQGPVLQSQLDYWRRHLLAVPVLLELPSDRPRPLVRSFRGESIDFALDEALSRDVRAFAATHELTLFMLLYSAFVVLLSRLSGSDDIVVGVPVANRQRSDVEGLIGFFVGTLALRVRVDALDESNVRQLLQHVKEVTLAGFANQDVPFEQIIETLQPPRSLSFTPIFQSVFSLQNVPRPSLQLPGLMLVREEVPSRTAQCDLTLSLYETDRGIVGSINYATDLFERSTIQQWADHYVTLLADMIRDPRRKLNSLSLLSEEQSGTTTGLGISRRSPMRAWCTIDELIDAQARATPDAVAVSFGQEQLTYGELLRRAERLAGCLRVHGVGSERRVAIHLERGPQMIIALLAVLKTGAAYVPLDPANPPERLAYMLLDAEPDVLLTQAELKDALPASGAIRILLEAGAAVADGAQGSANASSDAVSAPNQLAYVIYTSGTTGRPKGVMVEHRAVLNLLDSIRREIDFAATDRLLAVTTLAFDIAALELFLPLLAGARLVLADRQTAIDPQRLAVAVEQNEISVLQATPATWRLLVNAHWVGREDLKALCGGEALAVELAAQVGGRVMALWNVYGPTETTIWSSTRRVAVTGEGRQAIEPIGRPVDGTQIYVLDTCLRSPPQRVVGHIYIGGQGVARGYFKRPGLTAQRFVPDPHAASPGSRIYDTGDLGRWRRDGDLEYLGRSDRQTKIRGYRIELDEIAAVLSRHPEVQDATVAAVGANPGEKRLVAYVVPRADEERSAAANARLGFSLFYFGADTDSGGKKYDLYLQAARFADQHGFEAIWTPERHFDAVGSFYPNPSVLSAALATITSRVHLRAGSVVLPLHDPLRVAEEWAVVDNLSQGRVGLSVASGWHPRDFVLARDKYAARKQAMLTGIADLKQLWAGGSVTRTDGAGKRTQIEIFPKPSSGTLPLWITSAGNVDTFVEAGRLGANLLTHLLGQTIEELAKKIESYREALRAHGHDDRAARVTVMVHTFLGTDLEQAVARARAPFMRYMRSHLGLMQALAKSLDIPTEHFESADLDQATGFAFERYVRTAALIGTPASALTVVNRLRDAGVDEIACLVDWMDADAAFGALPELVTLRQLAQAAPIGPGALAEHCRRLLPDYMVPSAFVLMDALPLTPNGKLDRAALPMPNGDASATRPYEKPRGAVEETLAQLWQDLLHVARVGRHDDFFELGGHSLVAMQLLSRIEDAFDIELPVWVIFDAPMLAVLSARIEEIRGNESRTQEIEVLFRRVEELSEEEAAILLDELQQGNPGADLESA